MNTRWYTVKNCHKTLSLLLGNIQSRKASTNGLLAVIKADHPSPTSNDVAPDRPTKRRRTETNPPKVQMSTSTGILRRSSTSKHDHDIDMNMEAISPTQMTDGTPGNTASNVSSPARVGSAVNSTAEIRSAAGLAAAKQKHTPSGWSNSSIDANANPTTLYDLSAFISPPQPQGSNPRRRYTTSNKARDPTLPHSTTNNDSTPNSSSQPAYPFISGSALYSTQQELAFAHSSMQLPELPSMGTTANNSSMPGMMEDPDPMFWGNMDYNLADVFGSATWEQMTAGTPGGGLGGGGGGVWEGAGGG
jgi:hypothetical protein